MKQFETEVRAVLDALLGLLVEKSEAYGHSALNPIHVFSKCSALEQLSQQIDHKLQRVKMGKELGEDVVQDLVGYLVLLMVARKRAAHGSEWMIGGVATGGAPGAPRDDGEENTEKILPQRHEGHEEEGNEPVGVAELCSSCLNDMDEAVVLLARECLAARAFYKTCIGSCEDYNVARDEWSAAIKVVDEHLIQFPTVLAELAAAKLEKPEKSSPQRHEGHEEEGEDTERSTEEDAEIAEEGERRPLVGCLPEDGTSYALRRMLEAMDARVKLDHDRPCSEEGCYSNWAKDWDESREVYSASVAVAREAIAKEDADWEWAKKWMESCTQLGRICGEGGEDFTTKDTKDTKVHEEEGGNTEKLLPQRHEGHAEEEEEDGVYKDVELDEGARFGRREVDALYANADAIGYHWPSSKLVKLLRRMLCQIKRRW